MSTFEVWITHLRTQFLTSDVFMSNYKTYSNMYVKPWNFYTPMKMAKPCQIMEGVWRALLLNVVVLNSLFLLTCEQESNCVIFIVTISSDNVFVFKKLCCQWSTNLNQLLLTWASCSGVWWGYFLLFFVILFCIHGRLR
jgi:hypothetical protein